MHINARIPVLSDGLFKLRNILLVVMISILMLPLVALYFFRIYENELVRQTELELISQSAVLAASYRQWFRIVYPDQVGQYGHIIFKTFPPPLPSETSLSSNAWWGSSPAPVSAKLDLTDPIALPRPEPLLSTQSPDVISQRMGFLMTKIVHDMQTITLSGVRILDQNGLVIAGREDMGLSFAHIPEVQAAISGEYASIVRQRISDQPPPPLYSMSRGTNIRVFTAFPIIEGKRLVGVIYLSRTPTNILKHLYEGRKTIFVATLTLLLIAVLLVVFVSSTISRPIRELIRQTERITQGEQRIVRPIKYPVTHEVAQLSQSFSDMSHALAERSDYIRQFAAHVSHEFKTPLTSMQGALELLCEHLDTMSEDQRQRFLNNLLDDTHRLKNLVNRLLELARADALAPERQKQTPLKEIIDNMTHRYRERGLSLCYTNAIQGEPLLPIAPDVMETILTNLFENSLHHHAQNVDLRLQSEDKHWQLDIADNGEGISPANQKKIFTPFFTTRRSSGGTGLGLEIIQSLLRAYQGEIHLIPSMVGASFQITLPRNNPSKPNTPHTI